MELRPSPRIAHVHKDADSFIVEFEDGFTICHTGPVNELMVPDCLMLEPRKKAKHS